MSSQTWNPRAFRAAVDRAGGATAAAKALNVSRQTIYNWMRDGSGGPPSRAMYTVALTLGRKFGVARKHKE